MRARLPIAMHPEFVAEPYPAASKRQETGPVPGSMRAPRNGPCGDKLGVPEHHRLAPLIAEALQDPALADRWGDSSDDSFRPFAIAVLASRNARRLSQPRRGALYLSLCKEKRIEVPGAVSGKALAPRVLKLPSRTDWPAFTRADWYQFLAIALAEGIDSPPGHLSSIKTTLVREFAAIPLALRIPAILSLARELAVPAQRWERLHEYLSRAPAPLRASLLRGAAAVRTSGDFWDLYFRCEGKQTRPFEIPDTFHAGACLRPLDTPRMLEAEAIRMNNCLASRISRTRGGSRVYFRFTGGLPANAELVQRDGRWMPGDIVGWLNAPVAEPYAGQIRTELERLASSAAVERESPECQRESAYLEKLQEDGRANFSASEVERLGDALRSILGKSRSWTDGAHAIFELKSGGFVRFMSSPDGEELLCEISSHRYGSAVNRFLTAEAVALIEAAGFVRPTSGANFLRWFSISSEVDIRRMAQIALAILAGVLEHRARRRTIVTTHVPH